MRKGERERDKREKVKQRGMNEGMCVAAAMSLDTHKREAKVGS